VAPVGRDPAGSDVEDALVVSGRPVAFEFSAVVGASVVDGNCVVDCVGVFEDEPHVPSLQNKDD
jgi:hypothetical protein